VTFTEQFIEVDGCRVRLRRGGKGRPLLYLHGASGAPVILPFMEKLAERFDVLVPEHPGYGQSEEPEWLENIHDVAYFYLDFIKQLDLKEVCLVGTSMGGWMAMEIAVRDTSRLAEVILVSPAGIAAPGVRVADIFLMAPEEVVRNIYHDPSIAEKLLAAPMTPEAIDIGLKNRHTTARLAWEPRFHDPHLPKWLHRIDVPMKIVWGDQDRIIPVGFAKEFARLLPKAQMHIIKGAGHLPQVEKVDEFVSLIFASHGE
jgi:pimeloyl-ACP methyl ester carboxylesterase